MTRITLNEINDTMEEIPSKLLLVINVIDKGNAETHQLLRTLIEEVQKSNRNQNSVVEQVLKTIPNNSAGISTAIQEGFQGVENCNIQKDKIDTNANKIKQHISTLWKNTLNSRKQGFFQYYKAKIIAKIFTDLLKENSPKMPRKFLPKVIPNENKEETAIRQQLSLEKFKAEINLQKIRSQKYLERFQTLDAHMIAHFAMNYDNDICNSLTELWENDCLKEQQKSVDIFDTKRDWYLNNTTTEFCNNSEKTKPKQEGKQNNDDNNNRRPQNGRRQNRYKNSKDRSRSRSSTQKRTNNHGTTKQDTKNDKETNTLHQWNQEIYTATGKISINLENSIVLQNNKKRKQHLMWS